MVGPQRAPRVLIVEDDARIASFLEKGLRARGFEPVWVETGSAALDAVGVADIDAVLLDLGLPDVDGLDVLARWRHEANVVPVVVLTARSDPRDRAKAIALGVDGYLIKPAPFATVVETIRSAVDRHSAGIGADG